MKRINYLFDKVCGIQNITEADRKARLNKRKRYGINKHDQNVHEENLQLRESFLNLTYKTSKYNTFTIHEPKERIIYRLPYYPDRIAHHAIMNIMEPIWKKIFINNTYACIKGRGIHKATKDLIKDLKKDPKNTQYCLKLDIRKFYPSVNHDILMQIVKKKVKDKKLLTLIEEIVYSTDGLPIGNYLSQYFSNLYLAYFDHWVKEVLKCKYYYRYLDDIVILSNDKEWLHQIFHKIKEYLKVNLKLEVKKNYQIFDVDTRGIDFVGYVFRHNNVRLRKHIKYRLFRKVIRYINGRIPYDKFYRTCMSYNGWLKYCDSYYICMYIYKTTGITMPILNSYINSK